ncbi:topless-related protein 4-like protein isoform X1 [Tanacetum coccineum]
MANHLPVNILPVGYSGQSHAQSSYSSDDLPKTVVMTLNQGSAVKNIDFYQVHQGLLLGNREKLVQKNFKVWDLGMHTPPLQASTSSDYIASVNRVTWSPDGTLFDASRPSGCIVKAGNASLEVDNAENGSSFDFVCMLKYRLT